MMNLSGIYAPIPTPFDDRDEIDTGRLRAALARWITRPLTGFVVLESDRVVAAARDAIPSAKRLLIGTGRESTRSAIRAARRAADLGADAALVRTPSFFKNQMNGDALIRHYTAVADASPIPVLLYNFAALTGVDLLPAAVSRLASHQNIIGMKESGGDAARINDLVSGTPESFQVLAGTALTFYSALCVGASGGILAPACVLPDACTRVFDFVRAGRHAEALALQRQILPLARLLGAHGVPGLKAALRLAGYDLGLPRPPLVSAPEPVVKQLIEVMASFEEIAA
jgi:dihydrodipicolinate synthase/N-acetylneuraminate lyase